MSRKEYDIVVVGAGFAGVYALHRFRQQGFNVRVLEAGSGVGGTWYWNRYPGARCDIESLQYSYSFSEEIQQEWEWSEVYAAQPEILRYINYVVDKLDIRDGIEFDCAVVSAEYDESSRRWELRTQGGDTFVASFVIAATGNLSVPLEPNLPGLKNFCGSVYRTHDWPVEGVSFNGKRVGLFGTGSSGVQVTPIIAEEAKELVVFQRTPNFSIPLQNKKMDSAYQADWKENYSERRAEAKRMRNNALMHHTGRSGADLSLEELNEVFEERWKIGGITFVYGFKDTAISAYVNDAAARFVHRKIKEKVQDPKIAERLLPKDHPLGSKRLCADTNFYETFNRENVKLVDLREEPLKEIHSKGAVTAKQTYSLDVLVLATGFDAMTGALKRIDPKGRNGSSLKQKWDEAPSTLMGVAVAGFPNLFIITGPGSPSVFSNFVTSIEQTVDWVSDCIVYLRDQGYNEIEATRAAETAWFDHVNEVASRTLLPNANSWYVGANVEGKPRYFMAYLGGVPAYLQSLEACADGGYSGFSLSPALKSAELAVAEQDVSRTKVD